MAQERIRTHRVGASTVSVVEAGGEKQYDEMGRAITDYAKCGHCGRIWDDAIITGSTPAPRARCPFEYYHHYPQSAAEDRRNRHNPLPRSWGGRYRRRRAKPTTHAVAVRRVRRAR